VERNVVIDGSKITITQNGNSRLFSIDAGCEIVYYMQHFWEPTEIIELLRGTTVDKLLRFVPGYEIATTDKGVCPTCNRVL